MTAQWRWQIATERRRLRLHFCKSAANLCQDDKSLQIGMHKKYWVRLRFSVLINYFNFVLIVSSSYGLGILQERGGRELEVLIFFLKQRLGAQNRPLGVKAIEPPDLDKSGAVTPRLAPGDT
jgi:hypothetical protein